MSNPVRHDLIHHTSLQPLAGWTHNPCPALPAPQAVGDRVHIRL